MLAVSIVDKHHRELQSLGIVELHKSEDTCCGLLTASDHVWNEVCVLCMHEVHEVTAIVDDDVRSDLEDTADMSLIFLRSRVIPCENVQTCLDESSRNIVLSRKRITSGHIHLCSTCSEDFAEVSGLRLKVY